MLDDALIAVHARRATRLMARGHALGCVGGDHLADISRLPQDDVITLAGDLDIEQIGKQVLAVLQPSSDVSSFAGDEACCAVCLSLPFQPRRYDCARKHLLCEACTVAWQESDTQRTGACPVCPPELLPPNRHPPTFDKNSSRSLQATLVSCPRVVSFCLRTTREKLRSAHSSQGMCRNSCNVSS